MGGKLVDDNMIALVLAHPIRCRALMILAVREASPTEIAEELGLGPSHVAYHVRVLQEANLIELTEEAPRRRSVEHRYRAVDVKPLTSGQLSELGPAKRVRHAYNSLCLAFAEANCALSSDSFELEHHVGRFPLQVDFTGRLEVQKLYDYWFMVLAFGTFFELPASGRHRGSVRRSDKP
jgi:DNA-binding transcriptional ArsR family regulator